MSSKDNNPAESPLSRALPLIIVAIISGSLPLLGVYLNAHLTARHSANEKIIDKYSEWYSIVTHESNSVKNELSSFRESFKINTEQFDEFLAGCKILSESTTNSIETIIRHTLPIALMESPGKHREDMLLFMSTIIRYAAETEWEFHLLDIRMRDQFSEYRNNRTDRSAQEKNIHNMETLTADFLARYRDMSLNIEQSMNQIIRNKSYKF